MRVLLSAGTGLESDLTQLRESLGQVCFPAQPDDVLAALVRRRAPSRLLWHVGALPRTRRYHSLDDLCDHVALGSGPGAPPPPGR
jgi:hypothetical protein